MDTQDPDDRDPYLTEALLLYAGAVGLWWWGCGGGVGRDIRGTVSLSGLMPESGGAKPGAAGHLM